jgi:PadR family transcriptional regulator PadR
VTNAVRMTPTTRAVLRVFLDRPSSSRYGFDVARESGIATGSLYPILARLEEAGWLTSAWESSEDIGAGRPRRRYYQLSADGVVATRSALADSGTPAGRRSWKPAAGSL